MDEFIEPRKLIPLIPEALEMLASETHRLHHAAWHDVRGKWLDIGPDKQEEIRKLGWQPGHGAERPATRAGSPITDNGSGEDFLFMHREMIGMVRRIYEEAGAEPPASWGPIPPPGGDPKHGFHVPPPWDDPQIPTRRRLAAVKSDTTERPCAAGTASSRTQPGWRRSR